MVGHSDWNELQGPSVSASQAVFRCIGFFLTVYQIQKHTTQNKEGSTALFCEGRSQAGVPALKAPACPEDTFLKS